MPETVSYDVTDYTIAGTNWAVFGDMNWTNSLTGENGDIQVSNFNFQFSNIFLNIGDNIISISGTNVFGDWGSNSVTITRGDIGTGAPFINITNSNADVPYDTLTYNIAGTNNSHVTGMLTWTNTLSGDNGTLPVSGFGFQVSGINLDTGPNKIIVGGTNVWGVYTNDSVIITRGGTGNGNPFIDITNLYGVIDYYKSSVSVAGTNNIHVMGTIWWSNTTSAVSGNATRITPGSNSWTVSVPLDYGNNQIIVFGTNLLNTVTNDIINIYRATWNDIQPFIDITNANATVTYSIKTYTIGGTNNANVVGDIMWNNSLGGSGSIPVSGVGFQVSGIPLNVGDNLITVSGTNIYGQSTNDVVSIQRKTLIESEPQISTNALIFPSSSSVILAPFPTNIIWDIEKITDDIDSTNLTITKISVHIAETTNEVATVTNDISNLLGEILWFVPEDLIGGETNYVLKFEVVDSLSLTNSRIFWDNKFVVVPEIGIVFSILFSVFGVLFFGRKK